MKNPTPSLKSCFAEMRARIAAEHNAMHLTQLSLARWRAPLAAASAGTMPASQSRWYAQTQQHFHAWLAEGGFARTGVSEPGTALTSCQHAQEQTK